MYEQNDTLINNLSSHSTDIIVSNHGTIDNSNIRKSEPINDTISNIHQQTHPCNILPAIIYRFKFTIEFMTYIYHFSKIHQYDSRQDFKESWKIWVEENSNIIEEETSRLSRNGYDGNIEDKMFKSARYYFRKKGTVKTEPKQRRPYINITHDILEAMDIHIKTNIYNSDYTPKSGFISFCKDNEPILKEAIKNIYKQGIQQSDIIKNKIKKTYKNRYFMLTFSK
jgi:hypothetical protein